MKNKTITIVILFLFLSAIVSPIMSSNETPIDADQSISILYVDDDAPSSWYNATHVKTIQEGVDNASEGDIVYVYNGTYSGNVTINKSINLKGENKDNTFIKEYNYENVIEIIADHVDISNFTISNRNSIWYATGILIKSNNTTIFNTTITNNKYGIYIRDSNNCKLHNNTIKSNNPYGIISYSSNNIKIFDNLFFLNDCSLELRKSNDCTIIRNQFNDSHQGVHNYFLSGSNTFYHNNFFNHDEFHAYSTYTNQWDNESQSSGNYWDDYNGTDANNDGIGDTPYNISENNTDHYPLMNPWGIIHGNSPPQANFSITPTSPSDLDEIQFNDTSVDYDGTILSWTWSFGDGNSSTSQNTTHQYADNGTYTVTLTVEDNENSTNTVTKEITVSNVEPTANFTYSPTNPLINQNIEFVDASTDEDGMIESWFWNFDDGNNDTNESTNHSYENPGSYNVTLNVTDDDGAMSSKKITIIIRESNQIPTANDDTFSTNENTAIWINVTANDEDEDGAINVSSVNITTDPVHGSTNLNDTTGEIQYTPDENFDGKDSFTYTVEDNDGNTSNEATVTITVIEPNDSPVADFTIEPANPYVGDTIYFNSTSTDEDGTIEDFVWKLGDGTRLTGEKITHEYSKADTYRVSLLATDNDGDTNRVIQNVVVKQVVSIQIASPSSEDTVSGSIKITGTMTADEYDRVDVKIDNGNWNEAQGTEKWEYTWDTTQVNDGEHTIYAQCILANDQSSQTSIKVNVENNIENEIPIISISYPTGSSVVSNTITFRGTVDDADGSVEQVDIKIDQGDWEQASLSEKVWEYTLNTSLRSDGNHIFYARSFDGSNYSKITSTRFTVQNTETNSDDGEPADTDDDSNTTDSDDTTDNATDAENVDSDSTTDESTAVSGEVTTFLAIISSAVIAAIGAAVYIIRI